MIIYSIYKIVNNINGKVYIGFDSRWPKRIESHKYHTKTRNQTLYQSLRKYGWDNFTYELIYQSKDGKHCLHTMEPFFINEYQSYKNGYNETLGGEGTLGNVLKEQAKSKISKALKGKTKSKEHILKMSETRKGKIPTEESLRKRSESMKKTLQLKKELLNNFSNCR